MRARMFLPLAAAAIALASCGGSDGPSKTTQSASSQQQCRRQIDRLTAPGVKAAEFVRGVSRLSAQCRGLLSSSGPAPAPAQDRTLVAQFSHPIPKAVKAGMPVRIAGITVGSVSTVAAGSVTIKIDSAGASALPSDSRLLIRRARQHSDDYYVDLRRGRAKKQIPWGGTIGSQHTRVCRSRKCP